MYRESCLKSLLDNRRILIAGYGREGKSTHAMLQRLFPGRSFDVAHNNDEIVSMLSNATYDMIVKSPGIPTFVFEGLCDLKTLSSQTDLFLQVYGDKTTAVTGTKGKSTTASLIYHLLSALSDTPVVLAGNIGIPLFDVVDALDDRSLIVAELSCHQLENIHRGPHVAVLLNLFQEHLDHYHDYMGYKMAKMQIGLTQQAGDSFFYCSDNSELSELVSRFSFESEARPYTVGDAVAYAGMLAKARLSGNHNLSNLYVALRAVSATLQRPMPQGDDPAVAEVLSSFAPLEHRLELVGTYKGITFYNDSISTIPAACMAAVTALPNVDTLILGGFDRGIDYEPLTAFLRQSSVRNLVFVGAAGRRMLGLLGQVIDKDILVENDYAKIVEWCFGRTRQGTVCLLSPAAASYDAFKNFEERGTSYKSLVRQFATTNSEIR